MKLPSGLMHLCHCSWLELDSGQSYTTQGSRCKVCWFSLQSITFLLQWCSQTIGIIYPWLQWLFFFSPMWSPLAEVRQLYLFVRAVKYQSVNKRGKVAVKLLVVWGWTDSNACAFRFEERRGAACYRRNASWAPPAAGRPCCCSGSGSVKPGPQQLIVQLAPVPDCWRIYRAIRN